MKRAIALAMLAAAPALPAQDAAPDPTVEQIVARMETLTTGLQKLPWRCFTMYGDMGFEVFGRWERGAGLRSTIYALGCSDEPSRDLTGSNKYLTIWTPEHVSSIHLLIALEAGWATSAPPHMLFRARKGDPDHRRIDPFEVPADLPLMLHVDEPLTYYQLAPALMFGHEPDLRLAGRQRFNGKDCFALVSERDARDLGDRVPSAWCRAVWTRRTFLVEADTFLLAGLRYESDRRMHGIAGLVRETTVSTVRTRQRPTSHRIKIPKETPVLLPDLVELEITQPRTEPRRYRRRVVIEDCSS